MPAKPRPTSRKLSPGYAQRVLVARARRSRWPAPLAWLWLVRWRTGRHRHALWKSLVLPAGGVSAVLAARDDAVPAAARLRAQLPADGAAHRAARAGRRLHRRAGHGARRRSSRSSTSAAIGSMPAASATDTRCEFLLLTRTAEAAGARRLAVRRPRTSHAQRRRRHRHLPARRRRLTPARAVTASSIASRRRRLRPRIADGSAHAHGREDEPEASSPCPARCRCRARRRGAAPRA